jgi:hypothetical protein
VEFETMFASLYNKYRLSPTKIYVSVQELINITKKIIGNGGAPLLKLNANVDTATGAIAAGVVVGSYWNKVTGQQVPLVVHPNMPSGHGVLLHALAAVPAFGRGRSDPHADAPGLLPDRVAAALAQVRVLRRRRRRAPALRAVLDGRDHEHRQR